MSRFDKWTKGEGQAEEVTGEVTREPSGIVKDINTSKEYSPTKTLNLEPLEDRVFMNVFVDKPTCQCKYPEIEAGIMHSAQGRLIETYFCLVCKLEVDEDA